MKRNLIKLTGIFLLAASSIFMVKPTKAEAAWIKDNTGWWYKEGKSWANNGWRYIDGNWYYFNAAGYMAQNTTIDGYYVDATGKWVTSNKAAAQNINTETGAGDEINAGTEISIGEEKAKEIAFNHAGVTADSVYELRVKIDHEDNVKVYEIDFKSNKIKYEYDINVASGEIISSDKEYNGSSAGNGTVNGSGSTSGSTEISDIGQERAKEIAFNHAGVSADSVYALRVKTDYEDNAKVYEINFKNNKIEYEYEINAASGKIVSSDKEYNGSSSGNGTTNGSNSGSGSTSESTEISDIGEEKAKEIAFNHAGVSADSVYALRVKTDYENKIKVYEVEFKNGNMEYEYEINASTGSIEKYDSEYDD